MIPLYFLYLEVFPPSALTWPVDLSISFAFDFLSRMSHGTNASPSRRSGKQMRENVSEKSAPTRNSRGTRPVRPAESRR